ncbi:MAG: hypothetical protein GY820_01050 [Gammaproteobacteria bacterium]|nr:hypothetical protein [Gammaproteobacteria bacterium]
MVQIKMYKVRFATPDFYIDVENWISYCFLFYSQKVKIRTSTYYGTHAPKHGIFSFSASLKNEEQNAVVVMKNHIYLHNETM